MTVPGSYYQTSVQTEWGQFFLSVFQFVVPASDLALGQIGFEPMGEQFENSSGTDADTDTDTDSDNDTTSYGKR